MSLLALRPRDENISLHAGNEVKPACSEAESSPRRYPEWLLEQRQQRCFTIDDFLVKRSTGEGKFGG